MPEAHVEDVALYPDGSLLAGGINTRSGGVIKICRVADGTLLATLKTGSVHDIAFALQASLLAVAGFGPTVQVWDYISRDRRAEFTWKPGDHDERFVWQVAFSPNGQFLAAGADDRTIRLWSLQDMSLAKVFTYTESVRRVVFDPKAPLMISASWDGSVREWSVQEQQKKGYAPASSPHQER